MTQVERLVAFLRSHPEATCAVCGRSFASRRLRGAHERWEHPEWQPSPELRTQRVQESRQAWIGRQTKSAYFLRFSNRDAVAGGQPPLPLDTPLVDGPCVYCGGEATGWDHVVSLVKGGPHTPANLVPACFPCNKRKQDTDLGLFLGVPSRATLLCGWCWVPVVRRRDFLLRHTGYIACSLAHRNLIKRWGTAFGNPAFAGPRTKLEAIA